VALVYTTDARQRLVVVTSMRHPTLAETTATLDAIFADPAYAPGFAFLYDRRRDATPPEPQAVRGLFDYFARRTHLVAGARCAVVLAPDVASARGTLLAVDAAVSELSTQVRLFLRMEDALRWLGVPRSGKPDALEPAP
jgi:hypothetical protein